MSCDSRAVSLMCMGNTLGHALLRYIVASTIQSCFAPARSCAIIWVVGNDHTSHWLRTVEQSRGKSLYLKRYAFASQRLPKVVATMAPTSERCNLKLVHVHEVIPERMWFAFLSLLGCSYRPCIEHRLIVSGLRE